MRKPRVARAKCYRCNEPADVQAFCKTCERAGLHCIDCAIDRHGAWHDADWKNVLDVRVDSAGGGSGG